MSGSSHHIIVTEVPPGFLKRKNVRAHFSRFGTIVRLSIQSSYCVITFENAKQAADAVTFGTEWKDMPMKIDFTPNHDPFGSDDAIINEELNWFAEEPDIFNIKPTKSKFDTRYSDAPPKKIGRGVNLLHEQGETFGHSEGTRLCKKHKGGKNTTRFLEEIKNRSKSIEDSKSTFRFSDDSKKSLDEEKMKSRFDGERKNRSKLFFESPLFSEEMTSNEGKKNPKFTDDTRTRKKFVEDSQGVFRTSEEINPFSSEGKSPLRNSEDRKKERESSPMVLDDFRTERKSIMRTSETKKIESFPTILDSKKSDSTSILRASENRKRESSPVVFDYDRIAGRSVQKAFGDKKRDRESSPMILDYVNPEGNSVPRVAENRKRDSSPVVSPDSARYEKSMFRASKDKRREREASPMVIDYVISEKKSGMKHKVKKKKGRESSPMMKDVKLEESKALPKNQEESLFSKPFEEGKLASKSEESKISLKTNDGRVAVTLQDKLDILEERDRQLRMKPEMTAIESVLQGTCPDMCPEKERILRELRNMVAPYEALPDGRMDHSKALKEYTRSSADQGKPLPHELRPEPVLSMTMSYLINCIISRIDEEEEENLHNWYDFCWGRLRAIRKDIIQQDLCDKSTVMILEQCARFHISCYDRLWGLSKSLFDDKLNTETLNNCLTSLVKCYKDLEHEGVFCPNEAEFNAYLILLNMNNGGFLLTQYQRFTRDLKNSHLIKQAVKIHLAYHNNMFSTYFKLTKNTSYLNACLAQRFFQHVRIEALNTIVKSHCTPNKLSTISVKFLMNVLKLDSVEDCVSFCESAGLTYVEDEDCFKIYRNDFYISEYIDTIETQSSLVLNKRIPIAEAVVGSSRILPTLLKHNVHESFTSDGIFKENANDASDQEEKMLRDNVERKLMLTHLIKSTQIQEQKRKTSDTKEISEVEEEFQFDAEEGELLNENKDDSAVDSALQIKRTDTLPSFNILEDSHGSSNVSIIDLTKPSTDNSLSYFMPTTSLSSPKQSVSFSSIFQSNEASHSTETELLHKKISPQPPTSPPPKRDLAIIPIRNELSSIELSKAQKKVDSPKFTATNTAENLKSLNSIELNKKDEKKVPKDHRISLLQTGSDVSPHKTEILFLQESQHTRRRSLSKDSEISDMKPFSSKSPLKTYSPKFTRSISLGTPTKWEKSFSKELAQKVDRQPKDKGKFKDINQFDKLRKKLSENMKKVSARKYLRLWKEKAAKLKASKEIESMVLYNMSAKEYIKLWGKPKVKRSLNLSHCLLSRKNSNMMVQIILHTDIINKIDNNVRKIGLTVVNILGETSVKNADNWGNIAQPNPVFWKLVFALPSPPEGGTTFGTKLRNWCKEAFYTRKDCRLSHAELQMSNSEVPVAISVHVIEGLEKLETCANLSALVAVRARDWETPTETERRIQELVSLGNNPIPVAVLNVGQDVDQVKVDNTKINYFQQCSWENSKTTSEVLSDLARSVHLFNIKVKPFCTLVEITSERLLDSVRQDSFLHDGLYNAMNDPNNIIIIYNQLIDKIEQEVKHCKVKNYFGTAVEFRNDLEKYQNVLSFPDNYKDINFEKSFSLRCLKCKLRPLKLDFHNRRELISFLKNYCDGIGCLNILKTLVRFFNLPDEDSTVKISDYLRSIEWLPFLELLMKELLSCTLLTFKVAYREDVIRDILESHFWLDSYVVKT